MASRRRLAAPGPGALELKLSSLSFGCMLKPSLMRIMKSSYSAALSLEVDVQRRQINIFFPLFTEPSKANSWAKSRSIFQISIDLSTIKTVFESSSEQNFRHLVIPLPRPPKYFRKNDTVNNSLQWGAGNIWYRATDILQTSENLRHPVSLQSDTPDGYNIGRWTAFRLSLKKDALSSKSYERLLSFLAECNVTIRGNCEFETTQDSLGAWQFLDHPSSVRADQPSALLGLPPIVHLEFVVRYQLEVCISRGILNEYTIGLEFLQRLASLSPQDATRRLEYLADQDSKLFEPMELFDMEDAEFYVPPSSKIPHYCAYVRKASITPTTILFSTPTVETSNRVFRQYSQLQDRFLRIQFLEESESGSIGINKFHNEDIWKRVRRTLFEGIRIGHRVYEFLAFGNSQLRQNGAYFFCPTNNVSCDDMRAWMGQFDHIKIVAKYGARLGQCFSTTREIRGIPVPEIKRIDDIERNGYCFTDGVGRISKFLAQAIMQDMTLDVLSEPTAFQFRMGGSKGVLVVWPEHVKRMEVHTRHSQDKFSSKSRSLEVIRCATHATATLNRQTVTILQSLGVPQMAFLRLLRDQIQSFEKASKDCSVAVQLLTKFVDENQSSLVLAELLKAGFKTSGAVGDAPGVKEPFVSNLLNLWISWSFRLLKEKARIHIPQSAFVLGCVDETGTLRGHSRETEGSSDKDVNKLPQIFLQVANPDHNQKTVIHGVCIVGRNPSLHPGDIRVVQAVDNPRLRHLSNVVIFPSTGDRPIPNMLSGGDLDGDDFFVIWDPELIPSEWNHPPMNYQGPKPRELDRDVAVDDMREFFVNYMKNDVLPLIATAHLCFADQEGPKSQKCLKLADQHSKAVDYPKTGEPATFDRKEAPKRWPHFMEKRAKITYRSNKALGAVFDEVVKHTIQFHPSSEHAFDNRILEKFEIGQETLNAAKKIKTQYDISVGRLLVQYDVKTEFELYSGWALSKPRIGSDYKRQEELGQEYGALKQRFREQCYKEIGSDRREESREESLEKFVAAMYKITAEQDKAAREPEGDGDEGDRPRVPLISFPWIFHWVMIKLAMGKTYKPGKAVLAAAQRWPPMNPPTPMEPLSDHSKSVAIHPLATGMAPAATPTVPESGSAVHDEDEDEDIYSDDRLTPTSEADSALLDRLAAVIGTGED
ncbi:hypothetical protein QQS21_010403 [Conoideocrella luteorostrata]|uniref:RNA-dependent RNA polymerase n=1 Tax=Conoideocrella luteorostrata TaxID=1105319 RepID=A0AAJ0CF38_9HYPO|nr:hypothetical protein QQS21_010403 [Conoideocrella luteorostrata]